MNALSVYLIVISTNIQTFFFIAGAIGTLLGMSSLFFCSIGDLTSDMKEKHIKRLVRWTKGLIYASVVAGMLGTLIPSSGQLAAIYLIPKLTHSEKINMTSDKGYQLLNAEMIKYLTQLSKKEK